LVPLQGPEKRKQIMRNQHRLSLLQMRVPRHYFSHISLGLAAYLLLKLKQTVQDSAAFVADIHLEIRCHLIIAAAAGMQFFTCITDAFGEDTLNRHVNIFVTRVKEGLSLLEILIDRFESGGYFFSFCRL